MRVRITYAEDEESFENVIQIMPSSLQNMFCIYYRGDDWTKEKPTVGDVVILNYDGIERIELIHDECDKIVKDDTVASAWGGEQQDQPEVSEEQG